MKLKLYLFSAVACLALPRALAEIPLKTQLSIRAEAGRAVTLSWPGGLDGFVLEETGTVGPGSPWRLVLTPPSAGPGGSSLRLTLAPDNRFFRLRLDPNSTNQPPVLAGIPDQNVRLGAALEFTLSATDANGDTLRFTAAPLPLPGNARLDSVTGLFTFRPAASDVGTHVLTFAASDGLASDSKIVRIIVEPAPLNGLTSISGRILDANDFTSNGRQTPVAGVAVSLLGRAEKVASDANGRFLLSGVPAGKVILDLDTGPARPAPDGSPYAGFREEIMLIEGVENVVSRPFYLPRLDASSLTKVDPARTTVVNNTNLNTILTVPPNTAKLGGTNFTGQLSISLVPQALAPAALPDFLEPGMLITIQPVGVTFATPAPITFPNTDNLPPGSETDLWSLDAGTGQFVVVGTGRVTPDGKSIVTTSGGIRATDWHAPLPPQPHNNPPPDEHDPDNDDPDDDCEENGSIITLSNGGLKEDIVTPAYFSLEQARSLRFVYNTRRAFPNPIIPDDVTIPLRSAVPPKVSYQLSVAGVQQGTETFVDTSSLNENKDETIRIAVSFDATRLATGNYPYTLKRTSNFQVSRISSDSRERISVVNEINSPFGAGWSLADLQRLALNADGSALLIDGDGKSIFFDRGDRQDLLVPNSSEGATGILRYHADTGRRLGFFVQPNAGGLTNAHNPIFGPDGNLYVISRGPRVLRFNGLTGEFIDLFMDASLLQPNLAQTGIAQMAFGPDGNLYTDLGGPNGRQVFRYSGANGSFLGVAAEGQGIQRVCGIAFGPDGLLYLADQDRFANTRYDRILRFNGTTGTFIDVFVQPGNLEDTCPFEFGSDGHIYIADQRPRDIRRFNGTNGVFMGVFASGPPITVPSTPFYARSGPDGLLYIANEAGVHRYRDNGTNGVLVDTFITGNTGFLNFLPKRATNGPKRFDSPRGDFSVLLQNANGTFTRTLKDGTRYDFNSDGLLVSVTDRNSNATTYAYDAQGRLREITDPVGLKTAFAYAGAKLERVTDPAGRATRFQHDASGNLIRATSPDGSQRTFGYDTRHLMTAEEDARGFTTLREYDQAGRFVRSRLPDGSERHAGNAQSAGLVDLASGLGTKAQPAPLVRPTNAVSSFTDGAGRTTLYKTGRFGELSQLTDAAGLVTTNDRDENGRLTRSLAPSGDAVRYAYDAQGNPISTRDELLNSERKITYSPKWSLVSTTTDAQGNATAYDYDSLGNQISTKTPLGRIDGTAWNPRGLVVASTNRLGMVTTNDYSGRGLLVRIAAAGNGELRETRFTHTTTGQPAEIIDALGQKTSFSYDALGRLIGETNTGGQLIRRAYDPGGNLVSLDPQGGAIHAFEYNSLNLLIARNEPPLTAAGPPVRTLFTYNGAGQLTGVIRPDGKRHVLGYNKAGRIAKRETDQGVIQYVHDAATGQPVTATSSSDELAFRYRGKLLTEVGWKSPISGSVQFDYDAERRLAAIRVNGANAVNYAYDKDGDLIQAGDLALRRDAKSGLLIGSTLGKISTTWDYNQFGEVTKNAATYENRVLYSSEYERDKLSRIIRFVEMVEGNSQVVEFSYDAAGRLAAVKRNGLAAAAYFYGLNGDRQSGPHPASAFSYDAHGRLTRHDATNFTYSAAGDLESRTAGGLTAVYTYDAAGNLLKVMWPGGKLLEYLVDSLDRRIGRKLNGTLTQGFLYQDALKPVAELDAAGNVSSRFVYAIRQNVPDYMVKGGITYRIITDHTGSPRLIVNSTTGDVAQRLNYDEFGQVTFNTSPGFQPFGFAGGLLEMETGLLRFGARDYDPSIGRWTTKDPLGSESGLVNLYTYARNDPVNRSDPTGRIDDTNAKTPSEKLDCLKEKFKNEPKTKESRDKFWKEFNDKIGGEFSLWDRWGLGGRTGEYAGLVQNASLFVQLNFIGIP